MTFAVACTMLEWCGTSGFVAAYTKEREATRPNTRHRKRILKWRERSRKKLLKQSFSNAFLIKNAIRKICMSLRTLNSTHEIAGKRQKVTRAERTRGKSKNDFHIPPPSKMVKYSNAGNCRFKILYTAQGKVFSLIIIPRLPLVDGEHLPHV